MKELQNVLNIVSDGLKTLAKGVETIAEKVNEAAKSQAAPEAPSKKPVKTTKAAKTAKTAKITKTAKKEKPARKPARAAKKSEAGAATDTDRVLEIIGGSKKGASTAVIMEKTGFNQKKVANIVYRLRKQNKINSVEKGVYAMA